MKKRKIFKKLFILLPNIQMTTINTLNPFNLNVVRDDTNKKWLKLSNLALFGTLLFGKVSDWNAQEVVTQERSETTKEIVVSETQADIDSTISYDEAKQLLSEEKRDFTKDEILEVIKNNKEILNNTNINGTISEKLYENLLENEEMQQIIQEMVNSDYIKKAVIEWDDELIKDTLIIKLKDKFNTTGFFEVRWIISFICSILKFFRRLIIYPKY